jgi:hypothetical protein
MEVAFIPQKIADHLKEYIQRAGIYSESIIFSISYIAACSIVVKVASFLESICFQMTPGIMKPHAQVAVEL